MKRYPKIQALTKEEIFAALYAEFKKTFTEDEEVILKTPVIYVNDSRCGSGSIDKVRIHDGEVEFYYNYWGGGWNSIAELDRYWTTEDKKDIRINVLAEAFGCKIVSVGYELVKK